MVLEHQSQVKEILAMSRVFLVSFRLISTLKLDCIGQKLATVYWIVE